MASPEENNLDNVVLTVDIAKNATSFDDLYRGFDKAGVNVFDLFNQITLDNQRVVFHIHKLVERLKEFQNKQKEETLHERIARLSETFKNKYPDLVKIFKRWRISRKALIQNLITTSNSIERNSAYVSGFRIFTSVADILGTLLHNRRHPEYSIADFLMENSSIFGIIALFLESIFGKKLHMDVKKAIKEDQELFENIVQWFKKTDELDQAIRSFFPYGIDKEIVKKIHHSADSYDPCNKIFMSILASNVKQNVKLFKDEEFLQKADSIASSEAGKVWFYKVILENDPCVLHCLNDSLYENIQGLSRVSPTENQDLYVDACRVLSSTKRMKIILNVMTIISAGSNLWLGAKPAEHAILLKLHENSRKELEQVQNVVKMLKPSSFASDPDLEDSQDR